MVSVPSPSRPQAFDRFLQLSARIGSDIARTQGAGGNTSIKADGILWVKASGTWLSEAQSRDIMVPVEIAPLVDALRREDPSAEKATDYVVTARNASGLRPSIETSFHAALPQPVVAHFHCVNTIALAVLEGREALIAERMLALKDLSWTSVPYCRPGTPLARAIDAVAADEPDVIILNNHGIIITGSTVEEVEDRIERVTAALSIAPRHCGPFDRDALETLCAGSDYRPAADPASHATALSEEATALALGGSLYPDHVIFLGTRLGVMAEHETLAGLLTGFEARGEPPPKLILVPGKGVLLSRTLTPGGEMMARCLAEVVTRIPQGEAIVYLGADDEYELTHWEAEQYRQALDRKAAGF